MRAALTVAACQPPCRAHDVERNARPHADAIRAAQARIVVFPELSLTGYQLDAAAVAPDDPQLRPVVEACAATDALALLGTPVEDAGGAAHIAMLAADATGVRVVYRKRWLGGAEAARFSPGDGPTVLTVDGWRLGLAICKDTGSAQHTAGTAALGVDAYVAGVVHRPQELPEQEARAFVIARACRAFVVFASAAGAVGDDYRETAGASAIYAPEGIAIARAGPGVGAIVRATLS